MFGLQGDEKDSLFLFSFDYKGVYASLYPPWARPCYSTVVWLEAETTSMTPGVKTVPGYTGETLPLCVSHNTGNIM